MHNILRVLRLRYLESSHLSSLAAVEIVTTTAPEALPPEVPVPAILLTDGGMSITHLQTGQRIDYEVQGLAITEIMNPLGQEGPVVGDSVTGIYGVVEMTEDIRLDAIDFETEAKGAANSLDNLDVYDLELASTQPSQPVIFGQGADTENQSVFQAKPFTLTVRRQTC